MFPEEISEEYIYTGFEHAFLSSLFALLPLNQFLKLFIYEIPCIPNH